jgi:hypothetical protein
MSSDSVSSLVKEGSRRTYSAVPNQSVMIPDALGAAKLIMFRRRGLSNADRERLP